MTTLGVFVDTLYFESYMFRDSVYLHSDNHQEILNLTNIYWYFVFFNKETLRWDSRLQRAEYKRLSIDQF